MITKLNRMRARTKLRTDMQFLYQNGFKTPLFTKTDAKSIDTTANGIMNDIYNKCLKPDLADGQGYTFEKADELDDDGSEFSKILKPVADAVTKL